MNRRRWGLAIWILLAAMAVAYIFANTLRPGLPDGVVWADVRIFVGFVGLVLWFAGLRLRRPEDRTMVDKLRFWGTVAKDGGAIRTVEAAANKEMAETLLMSNWTPALKALYEVKPVLVTVDTATQSD